MAVKDFVEVTCNCGRRFARPYPSIQGRVAIAPSESELKNVAEMVATDLKYHQNKDCPWMHNELVKARMATNGTVVQPPGTKLI